MNVNMFTALLMPERFWSKVDKKGLDDCWEWKAGKIKKGYGRFKLDNKMHLAHRISWFLTYGYFPDLCVLHKCDNPSCVNPNHLFLGTYRDNMNDMKKKGREKKARGEKGGRAILKTSEVRAIKSSGETNLKLAERYGVVHQTISEIRRGNIWRHVK